jgi:hypothetical protein
MAPSVERGDVWRATVLLERSEFRRFPQADRFLNLQVDHANSRKHWDGSHDYSCLMVVAVGATKKALVAPVLPG